eukprot:m.189789 g.189789  ORF g.189789 m.189789 type:complete len:578 (-) comp18532_c0_seq1:262-1995(-)
MRIFIAVSVICMSIVSSKQLSLSAFARSEHKDVKEVRTLQGFNHNMLHHLQWGKSLSTPACRLGLPIIRYPGGTVSGYWDWRQGWVISNADHAQRFPNATSGYMFSQYAPLDDNGTKFYTLDNLKREYLDTCALGGRPAERNAAGVMHGPVVNFVLNMLTRELPDQLELLRYADNIGIPVRLVELGNEYYCSRDANSDVSDRFASAEAYAANATAWATAIKQVFPNASVSVVGREYRSGDVGRAATWTDIVASAVDKSVVDAITFHPYWGAGVPPSATSHNFTGNSTEQELQFTALNTPRGISASLRSAAGKQLQSVRNYTNSTLTNVFDGLDIRITELNVFDRIGTSKYTWLHALQVASAHVILAATPKVKEIIHHSFDGCCGFATTFVPPMEAYFAGRLVPPLPQAMGAIPNNSFTAPGCILHELAAFYRNVSALSTAAAQEVAPMEFSPEPPVLNAYTDSAGAAPGVVGVFLGDNLTANAHGHGTRVLGAVVVNLLPNATSLDLGWTGAAGARWRVHTLASDRSLNLSTPLTDTASEVAITVGSQSTALHSVQLPPFSTMTLEFDTAFQHGIVP